MNNLYNSKDYMWSLFLGRLVIEKLLKGLTVKNDVTKIQKLHNLNKLSKLSGLGLTDSLRIL